MAFKIFTIIKVIGAVSVMIVLALFMSVKEDKTISGRSLKSLKENKLTYDRFIFAVQWTNTLCLMKKCEANFPPNSYNVHGLWTQTPYSSVINCNKTPYHFSSYNGDAASLLQNMRAADGNAARFIEYQVNKHGSCFDPKNFGPATSDNIRGILSTYDGKTYESAINTYLKLIDAVAKTVIGKLPKPYDYRYYGRNFKSFYAQTRNILTASPIPICWTDKKSNQTYFLEFRICLNNSMQVIDCRFDDITAGMKTCNSGNVSL